MSVGRRNVSRTKIHVLSLLRLFDFQGSAAAEYVSHQATVSRVKMLYYDDDGGKVSGECSQYVA